MTVKFSIPPFENVYTTKETAVRLKMSESFLAKKRVSGGGPKFIKLGRVVRYPESAIHEYLAAQVRTSTSDLGLNAPGNEPRNVGAHERPTSKQLDHSKRLRSSTAHNVFHE